MDLATLLAARFENRDVDIPGVGTITVRALSREELMTVDHTQPMLAVEQVMIAAAMVEPKMTIADVRVWQRNSSANEISHVIEVINELSGIKSTSNKEAYKSV